MGGEAIAHEIIGPGWGARVSLRTQFRCNISDRQSDNYRRAQEIGT